jgi:DNA polymerase-3 subunit delta'
MTSNSSWDIFGHDWAVNLLQQQIIRNEIRHAYLLVGMRGVGRRMLALRFAQALNCPQPKSPGAPCGICRTCDQINRMQYPDLSILKRNEERTRIVIEQIRDLQHNLSLAPFEGRFRFGLCLNFEEANEATQNAFLKTLEEAPEKVILLITADSAEALLPTIVSRCEVLRLHPLPVPELEKALIEKWNLAKDESRLLAHLSQGCVGTAFNLHSNPEVVEKRKGFIADAFTLLTAPLWERFKFAEQASKAGRQESELRPIFQAWLSFWSDMLTIKTGANNPLINIDQEGKLRSFAEKTSLAMIKNCLKQQQQSFQKLDQNVNYRLLTEVLLLDWPKLHV